MTAVITIISVYFIIIIIDIILAVKKKHTITYVMRGWYEQFIFVPFNVGVLFLGHFLNLVVKKPPVWLTVSGLLVFGLPMLGVSIYMKVTGKILKPRILIVLVLLAGYLVGDLCW